MNATNKIHVYFMPGMAASKAIFENIKLPENTFETHFLEWDLPLKNESLKNYAKRFSEHIKHPNPVLIGVSFGGILVQELANIIQVKQVIIISSVKSRNELPLRFKIAKTLHLHHVIPFDFLLKSEDFLYRILGKKAKQRILLYQKFLSVRDTNYLKWSTQQVVFWSQSIPNPNVIHIHGTKDNVFPIKNIQNCIQVPDATHILILSKYKWLNQELPKLIKQD